MRKDKKGLFEDIAGPVIGIFMLLLAILLLNLIFNNQTAPEEKAIGQDLRGTQADYALGAFLVSNDPTGRTDTMEELLISSYLKGDYDDLERSMRSYFDRIYGPGRYGIKIYDPPDTIAEYSYNIATETQDMAKADAKVPLPRNSEGRHLRVQLTWALGKVVPKQEKIQ